MLFSIKLDLSPQQLVSLKNAMSKGSDFKAKLGVQQLMAGNFPIDVNKALYNKVIKNHTQGKGMVITLPASILGKLAKTMDITIPKDLPILGSSIHTRNNKMLLLDTPLHRVPVKGGSVGNAIISLGMANEFLDDYPQVKTFLGGIGEDVKYLFENPMAISFKYIISTKIPNLNKRYRDIGIDIERVKKNKALLGENQQIMRRGHDRTVINLENLQGKVGSHIKTLIERLPHIRQMAEERNETIKARKAEQLRKQIENTENRLESLQVKAGSGLQVHTGRGVLPPSGFGLQIDPAPHGQGIVIDAIKARVKKNHIDPIIEREKAKAKAQIKKEVDKQKKKLEAEMKKRLQTEINKQKAKLPFDIPAQYSQVGGCLNCGKKKL